MKRIWIKMGLVAAIILAAFPLAGWATEVTPQTAEQVASTFWNLHRDKDVALTVVDPMLTTQWDQEEPYNDSCPTRIEFGQNVRALTGCVATAMAQVMKYWNYPVRGTGTHTYNSLSLNGYGYTFGEQTANFGATVYDCSK